jgi:diguanylate cyclase (GGDEF)-like protein
MAPRLDAELESALEAFEKDEGAIVRFNDYAHKHLRTKPVLVRELMARAYEIARRRKYDDAQAWAAYWLGLLRYDTSYYDEAVAYLDEALVLFESMRDRNGLMRALNAIASCYLVAGQFEPAVEWADKALEVAEELGNKTVEAAILCTMAEAYHELNFLEDSERCYFRALDMDPSEQSQAAANLGLARVRIDRGDHSGALPLVKVAMRIAEEMDSPLFIADCHAKCAQAMHGIGWEDDAETSYRQAIELVERCGERRVLADYLELYGTFELDRGNPEIARIRLERAADIVKSVKAKSSEGRIRRSLSRCYEKLGDVESALEQLKAAEALDTDLNTRNVDRALSRKRADQARREAAAYRALYDQMGEIGRIGQEITATLDLEMMLATVYDRINKLMDASIFAVAVGDKLGEEVEFILFMEKGIRIEPFRVRTDDPDSLAAYCFRNGAELFIDDVALEYYRYIREPLRVGSKKDPVHSLVYCPLKVRGRVIGVISAQSYRRNAYSRHDIDALRVLASYVAIAIENGRLFAEVNRMATFDSLTGLLNRRRLMTAGAKEFYESRRYESSLSVLMIDIDYFKKVNDSYGHDAGDKVLIMIADTLRDLIRLSDSAGRYGGEEFMIILPSTDGDGAAILAERIRAAIESRKVPLGDELEQGVTVSIGVYNFRDDDPNFESGVSKADALLYQAKAEGRNRICLG